MRKKEEKSKSLHLGFYFGLLVFFIILISLIFKVFETIKNSKFDSGNFFAIAILTPENVQIISISPKENSLNKLTIEGKLDNRSLKSIGIPYDSLASSKTSENINPKKFFIESALHRSNIKNDLTIIDLIKLAFYSQKSPIGESRSVPKASTQIVGDDFLDPEIEKEKLEIEIRNAAEISGLGNRIAKVITNAGGNVVLVNSSKEEREKSVIYFKNDSYTVKKLSKILKIPLEKKGF